VSDALADLMLRNLSEVLLFKMTWPPLESNRGFPHHMLEPFRGTDGAGGRSAEAYNGWQQFYITE
jgi:hypothetical protein